MAWIDLTWPGVCAHFATLIGKRTVTKSHKASLNCLFTPEQQLLMQQMGAISLHWGILCSEPSTSVRAWVDFERFTGFLRGTHEIEYQGSSCSSRCGRLCVCFAGQRL